MSSEPLRFHESNLWSSPIRDLGLTIEGTRLEPILAEFEAEVRQAGITRLRPRFYLSTEWGVAFETIAIAIPFYLAHPDLTALHAERVGHIEGFDRADIARYLRHEMGHVINYAYRLYDEEEWVKQFGSITQPYVEDYSPEPFSRRYVRHLPGWYAQKHPDEDWAETFATTSNTRSTSTTSGAQLPSVDLPPGLDGALRAIFEDLGGSEGLSLDDPLCPAADLIRRLEPELMANVFRWTGHFPERTRVLLRYLADRATRLSQSLPRPTSCTSPGPAPRSAR